MTVMNETAGSGVHRALLSRLMAELNRAEG